MELARSENNCLVVLVGTAFATNQSTLFFRIKYHNSLQLIYKFRVILAKALVLVQKSRE